MSKRFIALLMGTVLLFSVSILVAESKKLERPLPIPMGAQGINLLEDRHTFSISYIKNRNEQIGISMVYVGTEVLYPTSSGPFNFFNNQANFSDTLLQAYTYYDLNEQTIQISDVHLDNVRNYLQKNNTVSVVFSNGETVAYPLILEFYEHQSANKVIQIEYRESVKNEVSESQLTIKQPATIEEIDTTFFSGNVELLKGKEKLSLPYEAQEGENLTLRISPNERLGFTTIYLAFIKGTLPSGEAFAENDFIKAGDIPNENWIVEYVKKEGDN